MTGLTHDVAARTAELRFEDLPDDVVELARQCLLDWVGVTVAGSHEPCAALLFDEFADDGLVTAGSGVTVVGRDERLPLIEAALVNGTASHALDYDDVNSRMIGHPSVPILAALLALAERLGSSGADVVCAFVAGYEAECGIGGAVGVSHYQRGFHATGTVGTFGSAAACARLLGLDAAKTATALGIAAAQAAGLKSMFGTMCKPLHAGKASANGLLAARLAARGYTAAPDALECVQGFADALGSGFPDGQALRAAPGQWHLRDNLFKYHAACFQTHSSIEGLRRLRDEHRFSLDQIAGATVDADDMQLKMCAIPEPVTGLEAKFSLRHTAAMALAGEDTAAIGSFSDEAVVAPAIRAVRDRVLVRTGRAGGGPTPVEVRLHDGRVLSANHDVSTPETDLGLQRARLLEKFHGLVAPVLGGARAEAAASQALAFDTLAGAAELTTSLRRR